MQHTLVARRRFRIAIGVSVALHVVAALAVIGLAVWNPTLPTPAAQIDEPADDELPAFTLAEPTTRVQQDASPPPLRGRSAEPEVPAGGGADVAVGRPPIAIPVPPTVPTDLSNLIREVANRPPTPAPPRVEVVDVADVKQVQHVTPSEPGPPAGRVEPGASATGWQKPHPVADAPGSSKPGKPLHAPLPADKSVVYVLDRSSSMRLSPDTYAAARAAVVASLDGLPDGGRFQVVVYNGSAEVLLSGTRSELLLAGSATREQVATALTDLPAEGRSVHAAGVKAALLLKPDYVILLTDAGDDELTEAKRVLKAATHPVAVYLARVSGNAVAKPELLR